MTKIAVLGDTHFGAKSDSQVMLDYQEEFFTDFFFPELRRRRLDVVFHMGDLVDRRKYVNFHTLNRFREFFLDPLSDYTAHIICGNHDVFYKSTNRVNALDELCADRGINVHTWPKTLSVFDENDIAVLPWMNIDNKEEWGEVLTTSEAPYCFGHLEINGFLMTRGFACDHGWKPSVFGRFDKVLSGHFHLRSENKNILYVGTPYDLDWNDCDSRKGFHVFDTYDGSVEFIEYPKKLYHKIEIDDASVDIESLTQSIRQSRSRYKNSYVKIYVSNRRGSANVDRIVSALEEDCSPADVKVVETSSLDANTEGSRVVSSMDDTLTMLKKSVDSMDIKDREKQHLKRLLVSTYEEAQGLES